jgi:hypothetical protein
MMTGFATAANVSFDGPHCLGWADVRNGPTAEFCERAKQWSLIFSLTQFMGNKAEYSLVRYCTYLL